MHAVADSRQQIRVDEDVLIDLRKTQRKLKQRGFRFSVNGVANMAMRHGMESLCKYVGRVANK